MTMPDPVPAHDPAEDIEVTPVGDEGQPVDDLGADPTDTHVEGVDREA